MGVAANQRNLSTSHKTKLTSIGYSPSPHVSRSLSPLKQDVSYLVSYNTNNTYFLHGPWNLEAEVPTLCCATLRAGSVSSAVAPTCVSIAFRPAEVKRESRLVCDGDGDDGDSATTMTADVINGTQSPHDLQMRVSVKTDESMIEYDSHVAREEPTTMIFDEARPELCDICINPECAQDGDDGDEEHSATSSDSARQPARPRRVGGVALSPGSGQKLRRVRTCSIEACPRRPSFGYAADKVANRCGSHRLEGQVDVTSRRCAHPGCPRIPSYRRVGEKGSTYCAAHKEAGMEDYHRVNRRCQNPGGCNRNPSFGFAGCKRTRCAKHKVEGMTNLNVMPCRENGCKRGPNFALPGKAPSYCAQHKKEGMVNVVSRRCEHPSCDRIPSYGAEDGKRKAVFCKQHKSDDMVNVRHRRCAQSGCTRQPGFGPAGSKLAVYCKAHKEDSMVDVVNNYEGRKRARAARRPTLSDEE